MKHYIHCGINCIRLFALYSILLGIGYLLGNAFPTFEVVPYGYKALTGNPLQLNMGCAPECEDFNDEVK